MGIQHEEAIPASFANAFDKAYLGNPALVSALVGEFCAKVETLVAAKLAGSITQKQLDASVSAEIVECADIFAGRNPEFTVINGYHGQTLAAKLIGDLGPHWRVVRANWKDDPTSVLFDWLARLVMEAARKWPDESDDWMKEIDLKPTIQYAVKVLLGIEERATS